MSGEKIELKQIMQAEEAASYLEELARAIRSGKIVLQKDDQEMVVTPPETLMVEVEAKRKKDKCKFELELEWRDTPQDAEDPGLTIADSEKGEKDRGQAPPPAQASSSLPAEKKSAPPAKKAGDKPAEEHKKPPMAQAGGKGADKECEGGGSKAATNRSGGATTKASTASKGKATAEKTATGKGKATSASKKKTGKKSSR